jgi:hypothetical protein
LAQTRPGAGDHRRPSTSPSSTQVLDYLDIDLPDDEELDQVLPAGDLSILADLGMDETEGQATPDPCGMCCVTGGSAIRQRSSTTC